MPVDTTTITVGDVVDELDERLDEISEQADATDDPDEQQQLDSQGSASISAWPRSRSSSTSTVATPGSRSPN